MDEKDVRKYQKIRSSCSSEETSNDSIDEETEKQADMILERYYEKYYPENFLNKIDNDFVILLTRTIATELYEKLPDYFSKTADLKKARIKKLESLIKNGERSETIFLELFQLKTEIKIMGSIFQ